MRKIAKLILLPIAALAITGCEKKEKADGPGQTENLASITLNKTSVVLTTGHKETLVATAANGTGEVTWSSSNTAFVNVSATGELTAVAKGTATITATYSGKTATCTVTVKNVNDVYTLVSVQQNKNLKTFENNVLDEENEFRGETSSVLEVGDDNPVQLKPVLKIVDEDMGDAPQEVWEYDYEYEIKKHDGTAYVDLEQSAGVFDAKECTFDFAESAIGGRFKLTVRPGGLTEAQKASADYNKSVEVKVSNGWNVYSEKELAYANDINFDSEQRQSQTMSGMNEAWVNFRTANSLSTTYVAPAVFLQTDLKLKAEHLPSAFFYKAGDPGVQEQWVGKMRDALDIYCHYADDYSFNGNYFHIDTSEMPLSVDNLDYNDNVSHTTLFKTSLNRASDVEEVVNVNFKNCTYYGNSPRGNTAADAMGLIFFKIRNPYYATKASESEDTTSQLVIQGTFENFNVARACISFFGECGRNRIVIKDCEVSEGYSNGLYLWNNGDVEFINSKLANFGGPVMITDGDGNDGGVMLTHKGFHVTADEETIFDNYVTGAEPWFVNTLGGLPASKMEDIKELDGLVRYNSAGAKTFVKGSNQEMNMIIINYGEIPYLTFEKQNGQTIGFDTDSALKPYIEPVLALHAPVLNTDNGAMGYYNPNVDPVALQPVVPGALGGDYLDIIYALPAPGFVDDTLNLSIVFGLENI